MSPVFRDGEFEIYQADIRQPRTASLMAYGDSNCWLTLTDSQGVETTILLDLVDEADRKFADQLHVVTGVLAVLMSDDEDMGTTTTTLPDEARATQVHHIEPRLRTGEGWAQD